MANPLNGPLLLFSDASKNFNRNKHVRGQPEIYEANIEEHNILIQLYYLVYWVSVKPRLRLKLP